MKNLELMILRQFVFTLVPLPEMTCRAGQVALNVPVPISLVGIK